MYARQQAECRAQHAEVARPRRSQRNPRQHALDVADAAQGFMQGAGAAGFDQRRNRLVAPAQFRVIAQRPLDPAAQAAGAHRGRRMVDDARKRVIVAAREAAVELEIAPRRRVHRERLVARLAHEPGQVRQRPALRVAHILKECAGGADRETEVLGAESGEVLGAELLIQRPPGGILLEMPGRALDDRRARALPRAFPPCLRRAGAPPAATAPVPTAAIPGPRPRARCSGRR